jgi:cell division protein FtsN
MKQKGDELIVMSKRMFFLILAGLSVIGVSLGFSIGYLTAPVREVRVHSIEETNRTVLPSTVDTALAKKQEPITQQEEVKKTEQQENQVTESKVKEITVNAAKKEEVKQTEGTEVLKEIKEIKKIDGKIAEKKPNKPVKPAITIVYTIQVGAFYDISNAQALMEKIKTAGYNVTLSKEEMYKVRVGRYQKFLQAKKVSEELRYKNFDNFILKIRKTTQGGKL